MNEPERIITEMEILAAPHYGRYELDSDFCFQLYYVNVSMQQLHIRGVADWGKTESGHENLDLYFIGCDNYFGDRAFKMVKYIHVESTSDDMVVVSFDDKLKVKTAGFSLYRSWQGMSDFYPYFDALPMPAYRRYRRFKEANPPNIPVIKRWIEEHPESMDTFFSATCEVEEDFVADLVKALPEEYALYLKNRKLGEHDE